MVQPTLYGHRASGHAYKVALGLALLGVAFEYRDVDIGQPRGRRRADWQAASRFGEVPVLVVDGRAMVQSDAILLELAPAHPRAGWEDDPRRLAERLFWEANRIGFSLPNLRVRARGAQDAQDPVTAWLHARLVQDLDQLERDLADAPFLLGARPSVADIACAAYLLMEDNPVSLEPWPGVARWLARLRSLPGWRPAAELMPAG